MKDQVPVRSEQSKKVLQSKPSKLKPSDIIDKYFMPADKSFITFIPDSQIIQTYSESGIVHFRDRKSLQVLKTIKLPHNYNLISSRTDDGKYALCSEIIKRDYRGYPDEYGKNKIINLTSGEVVCEINLNLHWRHTATKVFWIGNNELFILDNGYNYIVNYLTGEVKESYSLIIDEEHDLYNGLGELTEDKSSLFMMRGGGKMSRLEIYTRKLPSREKKKIGTIDLSWGCWCNMKGLVPGGKYFYFGSPGFFLYNRADLSRYYELGIKGLRIYNAKFSKDGSMFALLTNIQPLIHQSIKDPKKVSSTVLIYETSSGKMKYAFVSPAKWVRNLEFSPDNKSLLLMREDHIFEAWSLPED